MPRPLTHIAKATLPDGTKVEQRTVGCKPYLVAKRFTINGVQQKWEIERWCITMGLAHSVAQGLRVQFADWIHKQIEVEVILTSCHITTGAEKEDQ